MKLTLDLAFAAAVVLGSLGNSASAAPVDISSGSAGFFSTPASGGFSDMYTFILASPQAVNVLLSSVVGGGQDVDFTSITLTGPSGEVTAGLLTSDPFESWFISNAMLAAGSYTLTASGVNSPAGGSYAGNIVLSGSSPAPPAGSGGPLDLSSGSTGFVHTPVAGAFSDTYSFTLASTRALNLMLSTAVGGSQDVDFTSVTITGPSGVFSAAEFTSDPFENWVMTSPLLSPGNYTITASGTNSAAVGTYVGSIAVAESGPIPPHTVPEPGTWALLLAGLGAAQATARRSNTKSGSNSK